MLEPYRALDLTDDRGAFAGFLLALLGAEVIAVEGADRPATLVRSAYGRGKRAVDVAGDDALLERLVATADVLVETGLPAGWDYDRLAALNPGLVHVTISPFGSRGPKAGWPASDLTVWAASGAMANCGDADRPPVRPSVPQAWCHAGAAAVAGALAALVERSRSGLGQHIDVSAQRACTIATQSGLLAPRLGAPIPRRTPGGLTIGNVPYRSLYPAADGYVTITHVFGAVVGPFTQRLMQWVHDEGFCDAEMVDRDWVNYERLLNEGVEPLERWEEAKAAVEALTSSKTKAELLAGAIERRLVIAPISTVSDVLANPQLEAREYWDDVEGVRHPGTFVRGAGLAPRRLGPAPVPGADTDAVRAELGARPPAAAMRGSGPADAAPDARPLAGVKVVDLMWAVAGPTSARVLADLGATVVRIESSVRQDPARNYSPYVGGVAGVERSGLFNNQNAGKLGITVDLGRPEGRAVVADLAAWADVVMESFSAGSMAAWGLGYEALSARNPSLIMLSSCLFGQSGPLSRFAGFGNLASALIGFHELCGWPDRPPVGPYGAYTDYVVPHLMVSVVLAALDRRRRTGAGGHFDFAQAEAALHFLTPALLELQTTGVLPSRRGNGDAVADPHGVWAAGDDVAGGAWVAVACETDAQRAALVLLLGEATLDSWLASRPAEDAVRALIAAGVPAHRVQGPAEADVDPQLEASGHWVEVAHPVHGTMTVERTRFDLSRTPVGPRAAAPLLNQHAHDVLVGMLGYSEQRFEELTEAGILR